MRTRNLVRNTIVIIGLVALALMRLLLWPVRGLFLSLEKMAAWLMRMYR